MSELPHLDPAGGAHMVDVGHKALTHRRARAEAFLRLTPATVALVRSAELKKGDALAVARIAGIAGAKRTSELLPLAHPLTLSHVTVDLALEPDGVRVVASVATTGPTGVEMEALTAASVAALNLYDMVKAHERGATIERVRLLEKEGGRSGRWLRSE